MSGRAAGAHLGASWAQAQLVPAGDEVPGPLDSIVVLAGPTSTPLAHCEPPSALANTLPVPVLRRIGAHRRTAGRLHTPVKNTRITRSRGPTKPPFRQS